MNNSADASSANRCTGPESFPPVSPSSGGTVASQSSRSWRVILLTLCFVPLWLVACSPEAPALGPAFGPAQTEEELKERLLQACIDSNSTGQPILLELGADWCTDCRRVEAMKSEGALAEELSRWIQVKVNVGRYDRHKWLIDHFRVDAVARWIALKPGPQTRQNGCNGDPRQWTIQKDTVLEPISDANSLKTAPQIVAWLKEAR
ncbi:MAG: hypothetical protein KDK23_09155 [Leptospiraceae bacterium]|nr:hypothetical protein [Leptospiraceae bacterium]